VDDTDGSPRLDAFLHRGSCLLDFVLLGRDSQVAAVLGKYAPKLATDELRKFRNDAERMAALIKIMDAVTDPKLVREAVVYRPVLIHRE
jgi:hypothetical protein